MDKKKNAGMGTKSSFQQFFPFLNEDGHRISLVGGGGKTSLMFALAQRAAAMGKRVLVSTTTHIMKPEDGSYVKDICHAQKRWANREYVVVGQETAQGKLKSLPPEVFETYCAQADLVLVEADGSKRLPLKLPSQKEPVIPDWSDIVIGVCGLSCLGHPLEEKCFRLQEAQAFLGKEPGQLITGEDVARILSSDLGTRKSVGKRPYYVVLNQCDDERKRQMAAEIAACLKKAGVDRVAGTCLKDTFYGKGKSDGASDGSIYTF